MQPSQNLYIELGQPPIRENRTAGRCVVWRVLGFGGKPNPVVFARAASFASRTAQALLKPYGAASVGHAGVAPGRLQLYVDDPVLTVAGSVEETEAAVDLVILWWLMLGLPLAWVKGVLSEGPHVWIGAVFTLREPGYATVELPAEYLTELHKLLKVLTGPCRTASLSEARRLVGKCARVAYIVPDAVPFAAAMWGALAGSLRAAAPEGRLEAPPGRVACARFRSSAEWFRALLDPATEGVLPLTRHVRTEEQSEPRLSNLSVRFDASVWGGGAILFAGLDPIEYFAVRWKTEDANLLGFTTGNPRHQTFWEYLTMFVALAGVGKPLHRYGSPAGGRQHRNP